MEPWGVLVAVGALLLSIGGFWFDYSGRIEERTVGAWQLLTTSAPGNSGKIAALEYLNSDVGLVCGDWLPRSFDRPYARKRCLIHLKARTPLVGIDLTPPQKGTSNHRDGGPPGAFLVGVNLTDVVLAQSNLSGAELSSAVLTRANLHSSKLIGTSLTGANLTGANLQLADLTGAFLAGANFSGATLDKASFTDATAECLIGGRCIDMSHASLRLTGLRGAQLRKINLSQADISGADFTDTDLRLGIFSGASARCVGRPPDYAQDVCTDFTGAQLDGADLSGADLALAKVSQDQLDEACGDDRTKLPPALTIKPCAPPP